jgi:hypothetical protein
VIDYICKCGTCQPVPDLALLRKFADGTGGMRTGVLMRLGLIEVTVTDKGRAALAKETPAALPDVAIVATCACCNEPAKHEFQYPGKKEWHRWCGARKCGPVNMYGPSYGLVTRPVKP